jgi:hypothetical protein
LFWPSLIPPRAAFVPHSRAPTCQGETHFGPFTEVLRRLWRFVTQKVRKLQKTDYSDAMIRERWWQRDDFGLAGGKRTSCTVNVRDRNATLAKAHESPFFKSKNNQPPLKRGRLIANCGLI